MPRLRRWTLGSPFCTPVASGARHRFRTYATNLAHILLVGGAEEFQAVNARVRAFLFALGRLCFDERHGPPLELVFVAFGEVARTVEVFGRAVDSAQA